MNSILWNRCTVVFYFFWRWRGDTQSAVSFFVKFIQFNFSDRVIEYHTLFVVAAAAAGAANCSPWIKSKCVAFSVTVWNRSIFISISLKLHIFVRFLHNNNKFFNWILWKRVKSPEMNGAYGGYKCVYKNEYEICVNARVSQMKRIRNWRPEIDTTQFKTDFISFSLFGPSTVAFVLCLVFYLVCLLRG